MLVQLLDYISRYMLDYIYQHIIYISMLDYISRKERKGQCVSIFCR